MGVAEITSHWLPSALYVLHVILSIWVLKFKKYEPCSALKFVMSRAGTLCLCTLMSYSCVYTTPLLWSSLYIMTEEDYIKLDGDTQLTDSHSVLYFLLVSWANFLLVHFGFTLLPCTDLLILSNPLKLQDVVTFCLCTCCWLFLSENSADLVTARSYEVLIMSDWENKGEIKQQE